VNETPSEDAVEANVRPFNEEQIPDLSAVQTADEENGAWVRRETGAEVTKLGAIAEFIL